MRAATARTFRYVRSWLTGRDDLSAVETHIDRDGTPIPATLLTPRLATQSLPAWIVLHGITRPGRAHPQLVRFTRALASSGCAVLVPEVPEWRRLDLAPEQTVPTVLAALEVLEAGTDGARWGPVGLLGFSFGAPQALAASAHPRIGTRIAGVVGFGGYCDLERTLVFQFTGVHEWDGEAHKLVPDPYGRWIVGANYLTSIPGYGGFAPVAEGLRQLAATAGDRGILSWDVALDPMKVQLREALSGVQREVFDAFAPPSDQEPEPDAAEELAHALAEAGRRVDPQIEPAPRLAAVSGPVRIMHGRFDHLIPHSEALRLRAALPSSVDAEVTVTRLFGHSSQHPLPGWLEGAREAVLFLRGLSRVLNVV
jgi:pimeloyl-ACP methyl ester carboxylesterase